MFELKNKVALVTGAARGIGRATALELAKRGAKVVVNYLNSKAKAEEVVAEIKKMGGEALAWQADVAKADEVQKMIQAAEGHFGSVDILINNATAPLVLKDIEETSADEFSSQWETNVLGATNNIQAVVSGMKNKKYGRIVNILSAYLFVDSPKKVAAYLSAKEALWGLTKTAAADLAEYGITVNGISPKTVETELIKVYPSHYKELLAEKHQLLQPEEVAVAIADLVESDKNGENVRI